MINQINSLALALLVGPLAGIIGYGLFSLIMFTLYHYYKG